MVRHENRFVNLGVEDFASIARALEGLELSGSARIVGEYERAVAAKFGTRECVSVNSGTVSIYTALMALGIGAGDEVIVAPTAPIMSALPIIHLGAAPAYADVTASPGFGFDPAALEASVTARTKAILCVPLWGYPIDMDAVMAVAARHNIPVVEDVAQSHGTTWNGKYLGTYGAVGCFSTHERKLITTGEGAFLLTNDAALADQMRVLSRYGIKNGLGGHVFGTNFKLGAVPAALGISQLRKLDRKIALRKKVADQLRARFAALGWLEEFIVAPGCVHNGYSLVYTVTDPSIDVEQLGTTMESRGVVSDSWRYKYQPMYWLPLFQAYAKSCPNAEAQIPRTITLPCHEGLSDGDIVYIADVVATSAKRGPGPRSMPETIAKAEKLAMPKVIPVATIQAGQATSRQFHGLNEPALEENPLLLYTLAYCELVEALSDTLFPPNTVTHPQGGTTDAVASQARVDRYVHCRAAWEPAFGVSVQLALRDLSSAAMRVHSTTFFGLDAVRRTSLVTAMRTGAIPAASWDSPRSQQAAFEVLHDAVSAGVFADPGYGGNVDGIGWRYSQFIA